MIEMVVASPYNVIVTIILTLLEIGIIVMTVWTTLIDPMDDFQDTGVGKFSNHYILDDEEGLLFCL